MVNTGCLIVMCMTFLAVVIIQRPDMTSPSTTICLFLWLALIYVLCMFITSEDKTPDASAPVNDGFLSFLMVGKTGYGKSSTGNTILAKEGTFKAKRSFTSTTKTCQREVARVQDHKVIVVDSPGLADTEMKTHEYVQRFSTEIATILATQSDHFNAILIIIKLDIKLTEEDVQVCETLDGVFGKNFCQHYGIVVVTHADLYNPEENDGLPVREYLKKEGGLFQQMLQKCNNRMICFDNKSKDKKIRKEQLTTLLKMTTERKKMSSGYKSDTFEKAKKSRDEALLKAKKPFIKQETDDDLNLILQDYDAIPRDCRNVQEFEQIIGKLQNIRTDLTDQDNGTNALKDIISHVFSWEITIQSIIKAIKEKRDHRIEMGKAGQQRTTLEEELERNRKSRIALSFGAMSAIALVVLGAYVPAAAAIVAKVASSPTTAGIAMHAMDKLFDYFKEKRDKSK